MKKTAYPSQLLYNLVFAIAKFRDENHIAIFADRTYSLIIFFHRTMRFKMPKLEYFRCLRLCSI